ncbi:MerR family transcriptional regulator [Glutamicibacter mishrai]|uniref:helix-turn-helix domain-containing protein n=1 Tax=Glutamicibacter mishrai TaxID=1775880 RepID=UPI0032EEBA19
MKISEVARLTGLAPSAIRYYEQQDMFSPGQVERTSNGYRNYTTGALRRLELLQAGRDAGFTLAEMKNRMRDWDTLPDEKRAEILKTQLDVIDEKIERLSESRRQVLESLQTLQERLGTTGQ